MSMNNDSYFVNSISLVAIAMLTCNTKYLLNYKQIIKRCGVHFNSYCVTYEHGNYVPSYYIAMTTLYYKVQLRLYW